jgi:predicted negative regulator of RcsB-dependent stress response
MADNKNTDRDNFNKVTHHIEIKNPDIVQKGLVSSWDWFEDNSTLIVIMIGVLILAGAAYAIVQGVNNSRERSAQEAFFSVSSKYTKLKEGYDKAKYLKLMPEGEDRKTAEAAKPATGDLDKDYGPVLNELEKVASEHAGTAGGTQASLLATQTYLEYGKTDQAIHSAEMSIGRLSGTHLLNQLAKFELGNALAAKGDCEGALKSWRDVLEVKTASFLHGEASLRSGICFEQMKQNDQAAEMYRRATALSADSAASQAAKSYLRALEMKSAKPALPAAGKSTSSSKIFKGRG